MPSEALNKTSYGGLDGANSQLKGAIKFFHWQDSLEKNRKKIFFIQPFLVLLAGWQCFLGSLFLSLILFSQVKKFSIAQARERNVLRYVAERTVDPDGPAGNCHFCHRLCGRVLWSTTRNTNSICKFQCSLTNNGRRMQRRWRHNWIKMPLSLPIGPIDLALADYNILLPHSWHIYLERSLLGGIRHSSQCAKPVWLKNRIN